MIDIPGQVEGHRLTNGLRVLLHRDDRLPLVAVNLWYHVGSRHDPPNRTGLAHLFEHMLFQGSAHVAANEHFRQVQRVGGVANGSTWYDRTNYYETLPADHLELGLWLESDRMGFLRETLAAEKLETQRQVVLNERRQRVDNQPYGKAYERLFELLFPVGHPYRWPVIGSEQDISSATLDEVRAFYDRHYLPANATLTLAGDFDPAAALEAVHRWFGELPAADAPDQRRLPLEPLDASIEEERHDRVPLARLYIAFRIAPFATPEWWAARLAVAALCDGKSSPLYDDLVVRRQLARDVSGFVLPTEQVGIVLFGLTALPGAEPRALAEAFWGQLEDAARFDLPPSEIERARRRHFAAAVSALQSLDERADLMAQYATFFDAPERAFHEAAALEQIDTGALRPLVAGRLARARAATLTVLPAGDAA